MGPRAGPILPGDHLSVHVSCPVPSFTLSPECIQPGTTVSPLGSEEACPGDQGGQDQGQRLLHPLPQPCPCPGWEGACGHSKGKWAPSSLLSCPPSFTSHMLSQALGSGETSAAPWLSGQTYHHTLASGVDCESHLPASCSGNGLEFLRENMKNQFKR